MAKTSTLFSIESFISDVEKDVKEKPSLNNQYCPGDAVIANILNFSKVLRVEKSDHIELLEILLN